MSHNNWLTWLLVKTFHPKIPKPTPSRKKGKGKKERTRSATLLKIKLYTPGLRYILRYTLLIGRSNQRSKPYFSAPWSRNNIPEKLQDDTKRKNFQRCTKRWDIAISLFEVFTQGVLHKSQVTICQPVGHFLLKVGIIAVNWQKESKGKKYKKRSCKGFNPFKSLNLWLTLITNIPFSHIPLSSPHPQNK